jgi:hypothetical protein
MAVVEHGQRRTVLHHRAFPATLKARLREDRTCSRKLLKRSHLRSQGLSRSDLYDMVASLRDRLQNLYIDSEAA